MPQKIDVHGMFIDPQKITDLYMQKREAIYRSIFREVSDTSVFGRFMGGKKRQVRFVEQRPYGIVLADKEQPDPGSYVVNFSQANWNMLFDGARRAGKNAIGHAVKILGVDVAGDKAARILTQGRKVVSCSIREIPATVILSSGFKENVYESTRNMEFIGGSPLAQVQQDSSALCIFATDDNNRPVNYILYGGGIDASDEEVQQTYYALAEVYNRIQAERDALPESKKQKRIGIQLPQIQLPKIDLPIKIQSPIVFGKKQPAPQEVPAELPSPNSAPFQETPIEVISTIE